MCFDRRSTSRSGERGGHSRSPSDDSRWRRVGWRRQRQEVRHLPRPLGNKQCRYDEVGMRPRVPPHMCCRLAAKVRTTLPQHKSCFITNVTPRHNPASEAAIDTLPATIRAGGDVDASGNLLRELGDKQCCHDKAGLRARVSPFVCRCLVPQMRFFVTCLNEHTKLFLEYALAN